MRKATWTFFIAMVLNFTRAQTSLHPEINNNTIVDYNKTVSLVLNSRIEYVLFYPYSKELNPYRVIAWSNDSNTRLPILLVVRQAKQVTSWTIPEKIEMTKTKNVTYFYNTSKTMCHDNMDLIAKDTGFSIGPLIISQKFILAVSTSYDQNVSLNILLQPESKFYVERDINYTVTVSPTQSRYFYFKFDKNATDTIVIHIDSIDDVCLTVSVQDSSCPVLDSNKDIKYEGIYQTLNKKGTITISKRKYRKGFFLVFVAKADNYECSQENSVIPLSRLSFVYQNNVTSTLSFKIVNSININDYMMATFGTFGMVALFGLLFTVIVCIFNRFGTMSRTKYGETKFKDYIEPLSEEEINNIVLTRNLTVDKFAKYPNRIKQRSFNYLCHTSSVALFYSIPVIQLVVTYQRVVNLTGNQDLCYYNFQCAHPAFGFSDFNHIFSNIGYILIGFFFICVVFDRHRIIKITKDKGIPVHHGLFYAMGVALIIEGILSGCYHICPSQSNYQFDTTFMYVMAVLMMIKLYQNRHPDINATAYSTFTVVGLAILIAVVGILHGSLFIWVVFMVGYSILIVLLSLKIYYVNYVINGVKQFYNSYQKQGVCKDIFVPIRKGRFLLLFLTNIINFCILGYGLYIYFNNVTDFGTFMLGLLMANTILHISFYTLMKLMNHESICIESILFGIMGMGFWIAAGIFFLDAATLWTVTPAESRQWNQGCIFLSFYDKHDVWHLLSAPALYFTFMYLMYLDDDLCDKPQKDIPVF